MVDCNKPKLVASSTYIYGAVYVYWDIYIYLSNISFRCISNLGTYESSPSESLASQPLYIFPRIFVLPTK